MTGVALSERSAAGGAVGDAGMACAAAGAARAAQRAWATRPLEQRAAVLAESARVLARDAAWLAEAIATTTRRPAVEIWSAEILPTLDALRWLARDGARQLAPRRLARSRLQWYARATRHALSWEPYGLVGVVSPGNAILFLALAQVGAALLAGNAVLWKPAPVATGVALIVVSRLVRAGLPVGLLQVLPGGAEAARALVDAGVDKLFFTGGSDAGRDLYRRQAARGGPAVLELSGRHVAVVLAGADLALAARGIVWGKLANGGRNCVSVQLVLAEDSVAPAFLDAAARALASVDPAEFPGPASEEAGPRLQALVADAVAAGARRVAGSPPGPTLLADVTPGMQVVDEEIQGPILAVATVASADAAAAWINRAAHRLSASLWSGDRRQAHALARCLDVGQVWINDQLHPVAQPAVTLAGRGASGFGASRGAAGLMEMVQPKVVSETPPRAPRRHYFPVAPGTVELFRATAGLTGVRGVRGRARALAAFGRALIRLARGRA